MVPHIELNLTLTNIPNQSGIKMLAAGIFHFISIKDSQIPDIHNNIRVSSNRFKLIYFTN